MDFPQIQPSPALRPFVSHYWVCTADEDVSQEVMYPTGHVELCIDVSQGQTIRHRRGRGVTAPGIEILGHMTVPTTATVTKGTTLLIAKLKPFAGPLFFSTGMTDFTNESVDLKDVLRNEAEIFYDQILHAPTLSRKISILETFLVQRLMHTQKDFRLLNLVEKVCGYICTRDARFSIGEIASGLGFSERYVQKVFRSWVGLTPKSFHAVHRFNRSLDLIQTSNHSLTEIAYACGYYDQAHFIKEFRNFTGMAPSRVTL